MLSDVGDTGDPELVEPLDHIGIVLLERRDRRGDEQILESFGMRASNLVLKQRDECVPFGGVRLPVRGQPEALEGARDRVAFRSLCDVHT